MYQTIKFNTRSWSPPSHRPTTQMSSRGKTWPWKSVWQRPECRLVNLTFLPQFSLIFLQLFFLRCLCGCVIIEMLANIDWIQFGQLSLRIRYHHKVGVIMHYHHDNWAIIFADTLSSQSWPTLIQFNPWNSCGSVCLFNSTWQVES